MKCINTSHPEFKALLEQTKLMPIRLELLISEWQKNNLSEDFPTADQIINNSQIRYELKGVDILLSPRGKQVFNKGIKNNWSLDKILTELAIPKEQKQLILDLGITDREQLALELASNYSYTIEINTAKTNRNLDDSPNAGDLFNYGNDSYTRTNGGNDFKLNGKAISEDKLPDFVKNYFEETKVQNQLLNTQHYSNLTVPGGTNYTENEIATPVITPSIKGHAQFATDNGIGWFRSDEVLPKANEFEGKDVEDYKKQLEDDSITGWEQDMFVRAKFGTAKNSKFKTRRILEVQSDIFQKSRDIKSAEDIYAEMKKSGELIVDCG